MITKEELEKLIKDKQGIYLKDCRCISKIYPHRWKQYEIWNTRTLFNCKSFMRYDLRDLYKTKDEAEFTLEFGNITRTETLKLPTYDELPKVTELGFNIISVFYGANHLEYTIYRHNWYGPDCLEIRQGKEVIFTQALFSKDDYINICRRAKDMF